MLPQDKKSESSKEKYLYLLERFKKWAKVPSYDALLEAPHKQIQEKIEDYVLDLKKQISPNSIPTYFAPIELFYVMNDVNCNFKK